MDFTSYLIKSRLVFLTQFILQQYQLVFQYIPTTMFCGVEPKSHNSPQGTFMLSCKFISSIQIVYSTLINQTNAFTKRKYCSHRISYILRFVTNIDGLKLYYPDFVTLVNGIQIRKRSFRKQRTFATTTYFV